MRINRRAFSLSLLASGFGFAVRAADKEAPALKPLDEENRIAVQFTEDTQRFGISCPRLKDPRKPERSKLLTRGERGETNNTAIRIDGYEYLFGRESAGLGIRWAKDNGKVQKEVRSAGNRKVTSIMEYPGERIRVTQAVEIVVGHQTRLYDTVLVKYVIENQDNKAHAIGLRIMLHAGIDGGGEVSVPDGKGFQPVAGKETFEKDKLPEFVRIAESIDGKDPNAVVAQLGLKIKGLEQSEKLVLCRWPQEWGASEARWDWPFEANDNKRKDPCAVIYWGKLNMEGGSKRTLGFCYGLGRVTDAGEAK
jgi:hypothetical protein